MRTVRFFLVMLLTLVAVVNVNAQKTKTEKTVVFYVDLHCASCKADIEKNLPFEKGVKDLKVDLKAKTITVTYRTDKNTDENLKKAIEKLDVKVNKMEVVAGKKTKDMVRKQEYK